MPDREKVIKLIEEEISVCESVNQCYRTIDLPALRDILAVIKEQDQMYYTLEHDWRMCRKLLKEQEELLHKKQKDIDRLCVEISELKHQKHDKRIPYSPDSNVQWT